MSEPQPGKTHAGNMPPSHSHTPSTLRRIGLFVDLPTLSVSARDLYQGELDYTALLKGISCGRHLVRAIAYAVQNPGIDQSAYFEALRHCGFDLRIRQMLTVGRAAGAHALSAAGEVHMALDVMFQASRLDGAVLATCNGEFVALAERLKQIGCQVEVIGFKQVMPQELMRAADRFYDIPPAWVLRDQKTGDSRASLGPTSRG